MHCSSLPVRRQTRGSARLPESLPPFGGKSPFRWQRDCIRLPDSSRASARQCPKWPAQTSDVGKNSRLNLCPEQATFDAGGVKTRGAITKGVTHCSGPTDRQGCLADWNRTPVTRSGSSPICWPAALSCVRTPTQPCPPCDLCSEARALSESER